MPILKGCLDDSWRLTQREVGKAVSVATSLCSQVARQPHDRLPGALVHPCRLAGRNLNLGLVWPELPERLVTEAFPRMSRV